MLTQTSNRLILAGNITFTRREWDVLACILGGRSSKKIAQILSIAPKTAETHVRNIMLKIGCNSKEAIIDYMEQSEHYQSIKQHYAHLVLQPMFERSLEHIKSIENFQAVHVFWHDEASSANHPWLSKCAQVLSALGMVVDESSQRTPSAECVPSGITHTVAVLHECGSVCDTWLSRLRNLSGSAKLIVLDMRPDPTPLSSTEVICAKSYEHRYAFILQLVLMLNDSAKIQQCIQAFNQQCDTLLGQATPTASSQVPSSNHTASMTKWMLVAMLFGLSIGYFVLNRWHQSMALDCSYKNSPVLQHEKQQLALKRMHLLGLVPPKNRFFTGRTQEFSAIRTSLNTQTMGIVFQVISGLAGMGKTQLVTEWVYRSLQNKDYDGVLWITAENIGVMNDAYRRTAEQLYLDCKGMDPKDVRQWVHKTLFEYYRDKKLLIVLDNASEYSDEIKAYRRELQQLWATTQPLHVLVTSRNQSWPFLTLILDTFTLDEARTYVKRSLPHESDAAIDQLITSLHRFPLVLSAAVAYINQHTHIDNYLKNHQANQTAFLSQFAAGHDEYQVSLWSAWRIGRSHLSSLAIQMIHLSAYLHPDDIPMAFFQAMAPSADLDKAINELRSHSFITLNEARRSFKIHRSLQEVIRLDASRQKEGTQILSQAMDLMRGKFDFDYTQPMQWDAWSQYLSHARYVAFHGFRQPQLLRHSLVLYTKTAMFLTHILWDTTEAVSVWKKLLSRIETHFSTEASRSVIAQIKSHMSFSWRCLGRFELANQVMQEALQLYQQPTSSWSEDIQQITNALRIMPLEPHLNVASSTLMDKAYALTGDAANARFQGQYMKAYQDYDRAYHELMRPSTVARYGQTAHHRSGVWYLLSRKMSTWLYEGRFEEVLPMVKAAEQQCIALFGTVHPEYAYLQDIIAKAYEIQGDTDQSAAAAKRSLAIRQSLFAHSHPSQAHSLILLGKNAHRRGEHDQALKYFQQAEHLLTNSSYDRPRPSVPFLYLYLSRAQEYLQDYQASLALLRESHRLAQYYFGEEMRILSKHQMHYDTAWPDVTQPVVAFDYYQKALPLWVALFGPHHIQVARGHYLLAETLLKRHRFDQSLYHYQQAMAITQAASDDRFGANHQTKQRLIQHKITRCRMLKQARAAR